MKLNKIELEVLSPIEKVLHFWDNVWSAPYDLDLIDSLMTEDFIITNSGKDIVGRENFKKWIADFLQQIGDANLENIDIFESADGTKVVSRWVLTGVHNGFFGLKATGKPIKISGTAVWLIRENKLAHNWVERNAWEVYNELIK
jgi:predicted ester cyclase